ncbi:MULTISPECIES: extracellular solute-binding protein [Enterocloster]|mgnify:FL=1|uniref:Carbohydrate ABC transporter substrate-binding protein, CUT1 family n=2 Tax=Enterocloster lavalensis TaxID=460384 RepID=A0A1I0HJU3_9FIRM|nr:MULTISPECIES: extracellular solute-binding protein [Enterocloster]MDR3759537.1 extracellular solute-binding protein [Enterocloster sp.]SET83969.1 carbohydrate ABC transporter substrate-binding protein, CUT1 family [Enterocloster lavalensis]
MKKFTKYAGALLAAAVAAGSLAGCQGSSEPKEAAATQTQDSAAQSGQETQGSQAAGAELSGELEIVTNADEQTFNAVNGVFEKFMEENPGVKISYTTQGSDYEQLMKARMASNDLPDIFATHGWSVARYSEYLRPLNDQPWFGTVEEAFKRNIENADGQIFVLPLNMDQGGLMYNKTLLAELGIEIPKTWDEFMAACQLAKDKGYTGVFIAGKDSRQPANLMDIAATTFLASCEDKGYTDQLADGSFDWNNWTPVSQLLMDLKAKGYLNVDCVTCDPVDAAPRMAENNILFLMSSSPDLIGQAQEINPEAQYGMAPIPALNDSYEPAFCGGEREAYGIWKDTENEALCLALLDYLAKPENVKIVCEASGKRPAIQNVSPDLGSVAEDYATYADTAIYPFFDRVYLPNGMWSTMKTIGSALIGEEMTVEESVQTMQADYETLREQN